MSDDILFDVDGAVATIVLNRPEKLNAVNKTMSGRLFEIVSSINETEAIRVLVLTGAGERSFSVGSDVADVEATNSAWAFRNRRDYCDALKTLRIPVIAAINGYAYGGGLELALLADIRLASSNAKFAAAEVKLGWVGGGGVTANLALSLSASDSAMMLMTGDAIDAAEAHRCGLVSRLYEPDGLSGAASALAAVIASRPPLAVQSAKANLAAARAMALEPAVQYEREMQTICMDSDDAKEGRRAFLEKRPPVFIGR